MSVTKPTTQVSAVLLIRFLRLIQVVLLSNSGDAPKESTHIHLVVFTFIFIKNTFLNVLRVTEFSVSGVTWNLIWAIK